jgi:F0F1-type ATP synthase membrane subunit b/b'
MSAFIWGTINLTILILLIYRFTKAPLKQFVRLRHEQVKEDIHSVRLQLQEAQRTYEEFSAKLQAVEVERQALEEHVLKDAQNMQNRILTEAKEASGRILSDARLSSENLLKDLRKDLLVEFGLKVIVAAERQLKEQLTGADRERIRKDFSNQVQVAQTHVEMAQ